MTILSYIQHQTYHSPRMARVFCVSYAFRVLTNGELMTRLAIAWITAAAIVYLVAMYSVFGLGIALEQKSAAAENLNESNTIAELNLQERQTEFARNNKDMLQSMQKISDMRYVLPTDTTISRADTYDQSSQEKMRY